MPKSAVRLLMVLALACLALACSSQPRDGAAPPATAEAEPLPPPPPPPPLNGEEEESSGDVAMALPGDDEEAEATAEERPPVWMTAPPDARRGQGAPPPLVDKTLRFVRLFYGTNRARTGPCVRQAAARWDEPGECQTGAYYGGFPADNPGDGSEGLEVGTLEVTFPPGHQAGKIERPFQADFRGVPMLFSWPSRGALDAYGVDYDVSFESIDAFNRFLDLVKKEAGIRRVHVIAQSMGNRVVTEALYARGEDPEPLVDQLVLAAPDVWASRFKNRFLRRLPKLASRVTLYVSDRDRALVASSRIRSDEPRAGQVAGGLLEASRGVERFDAINASTLESDFLGHGYYANHGSMLGDIYCLLKGTPARGRPLLAVAGTAWQFRPPQELAALDPVPCAGVAAAATPGAPRTPDGDPPPPAVPGRLIAAVAVVVAPLLGSVFWWWWRRRHP